MVQATVPDEGREEFTLTCTFGGIEEQSVRQYWGARKTNKGPVKAQSGFCMRFYLLSVLKTESSAFIFDHFMDSECPFSHCICSPPVCVTFPVHQLRNYLHVQEAVDVGGGCRCRRKSRPLSNILSPILRQIVT